MSYLRIERGIFTFDLAPRLWVNRRCFLQDDDFQFLLIELKRFRLVRKSISSRKYYLKVQTGILKFPVIDFTQCICWIIYRISVVFTSQGRARMGDIYRWHTGTQNIIMGDSQQEQSEQEPKLSSKILVIELSRRNNVFL